MEKQKEESSTAVSRKSLEKAVETLLKVLEQTGTQESKILAGKHRINIMVTTHKIPINKKDFQLIPLPHPIYTPSSKICVFTRSFEGRGLKMSKEDYKERFRKEVGFVPKLISVTSLKKDYTTYESKKQLSSSYDLFLAELKLFYMLPDLLGQSFFLKKKQPIYFDWFSQDFGTEFKDKVASTKWLVTGRGNCSMIHAANTSFSLSEIVDNVDACVEYIAAFVVRGWANVKSLYIKSDNSLAVPFYINDELSEELDTLDPIEEATLEKQAKRRLKNDIYSIPNKSIYESFKRKRLSEE